MYGTSSLQFHRFVYLKISFMISAVCLHFALFTGPDPKLDMLVALIAMGTYPNVCMHKVSNFTKKSFRLKNFYFFLCRHSDFMWNQILVNSNGPKMSCLPILEVLNSDSSKFGTWKLLKFTKNQNSEPLKLSKLTFWDHLNSPKCDFT